MGVSRRFDQSAVVNYQVRPKPRQMPAPDYVHSSLSDQAALAEVIYGTSTEMRIPKYPCHSMSRGALLAGGAGIVVIVVTRLSGGGATTVEDVARRGRSSVVPVVELTEGRVVPEGSAEMVRSGHCHAPTATRTLTKVAPSDHKAILSPRDNPFFPGAGWYIGLVSQQPWIVIFMGTSLWTPRR